MVERKHPDRSDDRNFGIKVVAAALAVLLAGWVGMWIMGWDDEVHGQTQLVTDYDNYPDTPQAQLPDGCDWTGIGGVVFTLSSTGPFVTSLADLGPLTAGDTIGMSWNGVRPECVGAPVSLVVKVAQRPFFDPGDDQFAKVPYATVTATDGPGFLSYTLPGLAEFGFDCAYQIDAIVGLPLAVVGPNGSFYGGALRGDGRRTTLLSAANGAYSQCAAEETTTTTVPETTTTTAPPETTTTTAPPTTTTTAPPPSTTVPSTVPTTVDTTPTCTPSAGGVDGGSLAPAGAGCVLSGGSEVEGSGAGAASGSRPASSLAATGAGSWTLGALLLVAALLAVGVPTVAVTRNHLAKRQEANR